MTGRGVQLSSVPPSVLFSFPRIFDGSLEFNALIEECINNGKKSKGRVYNLETYLSSWIYEVDTVFVDSDQEIFWEIRFCSLLKDKMIHPHKERNKRMQRPLGNVDFCGYCTECTEFMNKDIGTPP